MVSDVNAFKGKLTCLETQLRRGDLKRFKNIAAISTDKTSHEYDQYTNKVSLLRNEFDTRFKDISKIDIILFMSFPFNGEINIAEISIKLKVLDVDQILVENEILNLKLDTLKLSFVSK